MKFPFYISQHFATINGTVAKAYQVTVKHNIDLDEVEACAASVGAATLASADVLVDGVSILTATMNVKTAGDGVLVAGTIAPTKRRIAAGSVLTFTLLTTVGAATNWTVTLRGKVGPA